ncbi:MAG: hypothetical protein KDB70_20115 [Mycobacterium sp.]|jgi:hypothetical protein|nr:hypothetical protein [Mycobacterium sp.]
MSSSKPEELSEVERARYSAAHAANADLRDALEAGSEDEKLAAAGAFMNALQQLSPEDTRDKLHVPEDAGPYAEGLRRVMLRIPDGWGRWISCDRGWYPIIVRLDEQLAEIDPDYELHQVKSKYAGLRYYFCTSAPDSARKRMDELVDVAETLCEKTCEFCGTPGVVYVSRYGWISTCCAACAAVKGYGLVGERVPSLSPEMIGVWKIVTGDGDCHLDLNRGELHADGHWIIEEMAGWPQVGERFRMVVRPHTYRNQPPSPERYERVSGVITAIERVR